MKELYRAPQAEVISFVSAENLANSPISVIMTLDFLNLKEEQVEG